MSSLSQRSVKLLEKELPIIRAAIRKITRKLDTGEDWGIDDRMNAFTAVYNLCNNYQDNDSLYMLNFLYNIYNTALKERIKQKALPSLENKQGMLFLRELMRIWSDYFNYSKSLIAIFRPVERKGHFYVKPSSLTQISILHFSDMIWAKFFTRIDGVLLDKVGSGALIEERPNDRDAQLIKKMILLFSHMYRIYHNPQKYIEMVHESRCRNLR